MSLRDWFESNFPPLQQTRGVISAGADFVQAPKPRLASVNVAPSRDEFTAWRADPTTQFVMAALRRNADECREQWLAVSWEGGNADQRKLDGLRERSDALLGFTADYEAFCETLGLEQEKAA